MWRSSVISILRQSRHSLCCHNLCNPSTCSLSGGLLYCHSPIFAFLKSRTLYFAEADLPFNEFCRFNFPLRRFSSNGLSNDFVGEDSSRNGIEEESSIYGADELYRTVMENGACDKNMEKAVERAGIPLTTELVMEILHRLRFEEKIAFRFFMCAGRQEHYNHEYEVYNEMIDILSSTRFKVKQYRIVCDMLDHMKRNNNKKYVPVDVLLTILSKYTEKHLTQTKKCSKKKRIRVKTQPVVNALNLLLEALCKCCLVETAEILFKKVKSKVEPDANTFNTIFFGWCRVRNPKRGMKILEEMISMGFTPDSFTYNAAIDTFCKAGMMNEASELFNLVRTKGSISSPPTAKTYAIMILALVKNDRTEDCFRVVGDMIQSGSLPDVSTYKDLIEGMCLAGKVEEAYRFLEEMTKKGFPPDIVTYNCFLKVLCDNKIASEAIRLYGKMVDVGCMPSVHTFSMLIEMFFAMGDPDGAFETWDEMTKKGCDPDTNTYCVMIEGLFGCDKNEDASFLLEDIVNKGMKLPYQKFDLFLMHLSGIGNLRAIHCLSEHMKRFYNPGMARRFALSQKRKSMSLREN